MTEALEQAPQGPSDAMLIAAVRRGETSTYGVLYTRHLAAAKRAAGCLANTSAEREDLVAEAFTRVLQSLRSGRGPLEEFRPYLLVTMRHLAINAARRAPATALFAELPEAYLRPVNDDPVAARLRSNDAASAFAGLPERWRVVLWHTEIEGESPANIAPVLGMTPNGVAALAYRAREGLRLAYLRQHLPRVERRECRDTTAKLAGWVRRTISVQQRRKIASHLARCPRCRDIANDLQELNGELRASLAPIVLGAPFAAAYLKASVVSTASSGLATTVSWLSTVKASVSAAAAQAGAAAAIAAVTAVTVVASDSSPVAGQRGRPLAAGGTAAPAPEAGPAPKGPAAAEVDQPRLQDAVAPSAPIRFNPIPVENVKPAAKPATAGPAEKPKPAEKPEKAERPQQPGPAGARSGPANRSTGGTDANRTRGRHAGPPHAPVARGSQQSSAQGGQPAAENAQPGGPATC